MSEIRLVFPLPPNRNRGNRAGSWAWASAKKKWQKAADLRAALPDFPPPPTTPYARVRLAAVLVMPAAMDDDNAFYRASKCPCDWLVSRGYLVDDSRKYVRWDGLPDQIISRSESPRVELTITVIA